MGSVHSLSSEKVVWIILAQIQRRVKLKINIDFWRKPLYNLVVTVQSGVNLDKEVFLL